MADERRAEEITLGLLVAVERDAGISQRRLSSELGVALGLANSYLKRCVRKGLVKVQQVPRGRYAYYLTPQGFTEKARLTGEYLTSSLQFYRRARTQLGAEMSRCAANGWRRVVLVGATELAEIATLTAHDHDVELVGVLDGQLAATRFCGLPVAHDIAALGPVDAAILTEMRDNETVKGALVARLGEARVLTPTLVRMAETKRQFQRVRPQSKDISTAEETSG